MKYKVIGWTDYCDETVPVKGRFLTGAARRAIVEEIKRCGYLFSGWHHQEYAGCVPVLNDGHRWCLSARTWGGLMAEAYGDESEYGYARYSFWGTIDHPVFPKAGYSRADLIPEESAREHFEVTLDAAELQKAKEEGVVRLPNEKYIDSIGVGDTLTLRSGESSLYVRVTYFDSPICGRTDEGWLAVRQEISFESIDV